MPNPPSTHNNRAEHVVQNISGFMDDLEPAGRPLSQDEEEAVFLQVIDAPYDGKKLEVYNKFRSRQDIYEEMKRLPPHRNRWLNDPLLVNDIGSISSQWSQQFGGGDTHFYRLVNRTSLQQDPLDFDLHPRDSYLTCAQDTNDRLIVIIVNDVWSSQRFRMNTTITGEAFENPRSISSIVTGDSWVSFSDGSLETFAKLLVLDFFVASIYLQPVDYYEKLIYPQVSEKKEKEDIKLLLTKNPHLQVPLGLFEPRLFAKSREAFKEIEDAEGILRSVNNLVGSIDCVIDALQKTDILGAEQPIHKDYTRRTQKLKRLSSERRSNAQRALEALNRHRNKVRIREGLSVENDQTKREFVELPISPNDVKADASAFSASIVNRKLSNKSNMQREELASRLVDRCQSMFLAIKLLEDDLRGGKNLKQLQRAIDQAPQKLDNIYDRNWDRIQRLENSTRSRAFSILRLATFAVRPLTILELTECLLITGECDEIDYEELPDTVDDIYVKTEILEICGSLIEIRGEPSSILGHSTVHLAHFSVREYILYRMPFYGVDPIANEQLRSSSVGIQNNTLAMLCLHYLNCDQTWKEVELGQPGGTIIHAFRRYAANSWHLHVRREAANSGQTFQTINTFFRPPNPNWEQWRMECVDIFPEDWLSHNEREIEVGNRLFYASLLGLAETVEYLIEEVRLEIDNVDSSSRTALIAASITGDRLCATQLLERGANVNFTSSGGATPLHSAAAYQHFDIVKLLLEKGADPCLRDSEGWTPLLVSSELGDVNTVKLLLNHAAGINFADKDGWTPLAIASSNGHTETVEILINHATSIDFADKDGWTPLAISASNGHTETVKMLLNHAASIDLANKNGLTPLMVASRRGDTETVKILLGYAAGVNLASKTGLTPLVLASLHGHIDIVQILLAHGASVNANSWQGHTALTLAAEYGSIDVVRLFLDHGVSIDTSGSYGRSVLSYAAESENTELVELLLQRGANPNSLDTLGRSPIFFATRSGNLAMVYLILSKTSAALESSDIYGSTILSIAVRHGHVDIVEHLLSRGDIDLTSKDIFGRSVASWANVPCIIQRITDTAAKRGVPLELSDNNAPVHSPEGRERYGLPELVPSSFPEVYNPGLAPEVACYRQNIAAPQGNISPTEIPRAGKGRICGCSILALLWAIVALLSVAVIGLAAGTGVQGSRAHDAELKLAALISNATDMDWGCSANPDAITGTSYTSQFFEKRKFEIYCNSNAPNDPIQSIFTGNFNDCVDACASYSMYTPRNFPNVASSVNFTCFGVSFLPDWTNRTNALALGAPGNCYLKPGPQNATALTLPQDGGRVHAAILQGYEAGARHPSLPDTN
ncbi:hypothetical protein NUW58_g3296 [Xylaria curta]|uniref:Uncharacterized protein n=1 Tax=Xylaria curta TaxID=42375 RepID=A0ACC1PBM3_9PEZI|nr:hypothetical protein NUW58_g3296 [Xylaria curta]